MLTLQGWTQLAVDPLNGPNQNPIDPTHWTTWQNPTTFANAQILNNECVPTVLGSRLCGAYYGSSWPNDQWAEFQLQNQDGSNGGVADIFLRADASGNGYSALISGGFGPNQGSILIALYPTRNIFQINNLTLAAGDRIRFAVIGTTLYVFQNGNLLWSGVDNLPGSPTAGRFGFDVGGNTQTASAIINFKAGGFSPWDVTIDDNGELDLTPSSGTPIIPTLNNAGETTSWVLLVSMIGSLTTYQAPFNPANPVFIVLVSVSGLTTWNLGVTAEGLPETESVAIFTSVIGVGSLTRVIGVGRIN